MSWPQVLAWHLLPGLALTAVSAAGAPVLAAAGLPPLWALLGGAILVQVPLLLALRRRLRRRAAPVPVPVPVPVSVPVPSPAPAPVRRSTRRFLRSAVTLLAVTLAASLLPGIVVGLEPLLRATLFSWLPAGLSAGLGSLTGMGDTERVVTLVLWFAGMVLLGPIAEELYFRGELLPRIPAGPWASAVTSAGLFAAYHYWQPYAVLTVFAFALPVAVARSRFGASAALCAAAHCIVNLGMFAALASGLASR
jgi:membrane protease YdiL (CAAX protease family)